jgi:hypothetical protein
VVRGDFVGGEFRNKRERRVRGKMCIGVILMEKKGIR